MYVFKFFKCKIIEFKKLKKRWFLSFYLLKKCLILLIMYLISVNNNNIKKIISIIFNTIKFFNYILKLKLILFFNQIK